MIGTPRPVLAGAVVMAILVVMAGALACKAGASQEAQLEVAIVEAAALPAAEAAAMGRRGLTGAEGLSAVEDQRLTIALLALVTRGPFCREDGAFLAERGPTPGLEYEALMINPSVLAGCYRPPVSDRRLAARIAEQFSRREGGGEGAQHQVISAIWPQYITSIESHINGESLEGIVTYEAPGCWRGRIPFHAARAKKEWVVDRFDLPLLGWSLSRQESSLWKAVRTKPEVSFPTADRIGVGGEGRSVFSGVTFPNDRVIMVGFGDGGTLEVFDETGSPHSSEDPGEIIHGRPVVLVPSTRGATIGDFLGALANIRSCEPSVPVIGMYGDGLDPTFAEITLLTNAVVAPINEPINGGPRFCISPSAIHVSTGQEMPLPVEHKGETLVFAEYELRKNPDRVFLINPQNEAPFSDLEVVLVAIQRAGGAGAVIATERYRGIAVVSGR